MKLICRIIFLALFNAVSFTSFSKEHCDFLSITSLQQFEEDGPNILVSQNAKYLMPGEELEISLALVCSNNVQIKNVSIGETAIQLDRKGISVFTIMAASPGTHEIPIDVVFIDKKGKRKHKIYTVEYTVGLPNVAVALDRMNVLYIGIDNPINIAATAAGDEQLIVNVSGGGARITKVGQGRFNVRVSTLSDECKITVYAGEKILGVSQFRVRHLPVPIGTIRGFTSGDSVSVKALTAQEGVGASLKDFPIDLKYQVTGYTFNIHTDNNVIKSANCEGAHFSTEVKQLIREHLKPGSIVTIGNLFVLGPDGRKMKLSPLVYHIR